ncbi:MAG: hypothetical protein F7B60_03945 [Desulfurococcales archaeon]|nr:hypothetical protein [Desulfurococcales archaeon]
MEHLYDLFWSAIRGKSLDEFERFIEEIKGDFHIYERLDLFPFKIKSGLTSIPIQNRFLLFLEELASALIIELVSLENSIPDECINLESFIRNRVELANNLLRDLNQEIIEYKLSPEETEKARLLLDSYRLLGNGILRVCHFYVKD